MKSISAGTGLLALALTFGIPAVLAGCGPANDGANVHVSTSTEGDTSSGRDTVVHETTVVTQPGDTVTNTVVQHQTDTVVKVVPGKTDTVHSSSGTGTGTGTKGSGSASTVSAAERGRIDVWLSQHNDSLNQYGDPKGTVYTGGTPLFDEATGQTISKYDYIVRQHPDRPWMQASGTASQPRR